MRRRLGCHGPPDDLTEVIDVECLARGAAERADVDEAGALAPHERVIVVAILRDVPAGDVAKT